MESADPDEPDKKRPHLSSLTPAMARNSTTSQPHNNSVSLNSLSLFNLYLSSFLWTSSSFEQFFSTYRQLLDFCVFILLKISPLACFILLCVLQLEEGCFREWALSWKNLTIYGFWIMSPTRRSQFLFPITIRSYLIRFSSFYALSFIVIRCVDIYIYIYLFLWIFNVKPGSFSFLTPCSCASSLPMLLVLSFVIIPYTLLGSFQTDISLCCLALYYGVRDSSDCWTFIYKIGCMLAQ